VFLLNYPILVPLHQLWKKKNEQTKSTPTTATSKTAGNQSESEDSDEEETAKKVTTQVTPQVVPNPTSQNVTEAMKKKNKEEKNVPFQRVKPELSKQLPTKMFASQRNANSEWAEKADATLKQVKGRGFRHEKTKKKRGTYRGGALEMGVKSIKFED